MISTGMSKDIMPISIFYVWAVASRTRGSMSFPTGINRPYPSLDDIMLIPYKYSSCDAYYSDTLTKTRFHIKKDNISPEFETW